jgi:hypothetical protein
MNLTVHMKNLKRLLLLSWLIGPLHSASAMNYTNTDLLLVFREDGFNDVEFDLGPVTNFVGLTQGTQKQIGYDTNLVMSNFNGSLASVGLLLVGASGLGDTQQRVWLTDVSSSSTPTDVTYSKFSQIRSKITAVGLQGSILTASNASPVVVATGQAGSFTYVASDGNLTPANSLGGLTAFPIEIVGPGTLSFYQVGISTSSPQNPAKLLGSFSWAADGTLKFTAGSQVTPTGPTITTVTRQGTTTTLSFTTVSGLKYQLQAAPTLPGPFSAAGASVTGDGNPQSVSDTSSDPARFYRIQISN